jgi:hypothetical protein
MTATIVFDSSTLISFSESCLVGSLPFLKEKTGARFLITPEVRNEIVSRPLHVSQHAFSALRLRKLLDDGVLEVAEPPEGLARELLSIANSLFIIRGGPVEILQAGEAECVALLAAKGAGAIAVDEKTTRLLLEDPNLMLDKIRMEFRSKVEINGERLREWRKTAGAATVLRSSELLAIAAEKGYFKDFGKSEGEVLHAALFSLRSAGCSLTGRELGEYSQVRI